MVPKAPANQSPAKYWGPLFGPHYVVVSNARLIVGNFNAHMVSCLVLHCEEAFWAGDKQGEGRLKDLITGMQHMIEFKGKDPISVNNLIRLFVTGNPDWIVPASLEARRFAVFKISDDHQQDKPYFAAIVEEMKNGGLEALLFELMNFDLSQVDLRTVPLTDALLDQKLQSLSIEDAWWFEMLQSGSLPRGMKEPNACSSKALFEHYLIPLKNVVPHVVRSKRLSASFSRGWCPGLERRVLITTTTTREMVIAVEEKRVQCTSFRRWRSAARLSSAFSIKRWIGQGLMSGSTGSQLR